MAKVKISDYSTTANNNTDINSINIGEGCAPSGINDAIRELMRQLKEFQTGGAGDSVNSGGDFSVATNKFTVASASGNTAVAGTLAVTGVATLTAQPILSSLTASKAVFTDASKGLVSNDVTGTGNVVMSNSPTLVTPALGTPSSGVVTNLTGTASININGTVGATTPSTGAFTTLSSTGNTTLGDASGDTITVNGTTTFVNANPTLSAGTANGVLYLDGSKVATSGSALTFDGTNLGIGVASPTLRIQAAVSGATTTFDGLNVTNGTAQFRLGTTGASYSYAGAGANETWLYSAGTTPLTLGPDGNAPIKFVTNGSEAMRLTSTGLGIGTTSPGTKLVVTGAGNITSTISSSSGFAQLSLSGSSGQSSYITYTTTGGGGLGFFDATASTERARIDSSGNLLVGTTSLTGPIVSGGSGVVLRSAGQIYANDTYLNVNADGTIMQFRRSGSAVGSISVTTSATAYNTTSDYRLKDNPQPLTGSGAFIDALQPKTWNWKADGSRGVGFIAHEVQEVSPGSVVGEKDGEQIQAMEYGSAEFIANIIAELQSLRARVAQLESN